MLFDSPTTLTVDAVLGWHAVVLSGVQRVRQEAMRLRLACERLPNDLPPELNFATEKEIIEYFNSACEELDLSTVFVLIASAEARFRVDAKLRSTPADNPLSLRLKELYRKVDLEWKVPLKDDGILDAWKNFTNWHSTLNDQDKQQAIRLLGDLKRTLVLRHWMAHGRYWEPKLSIKSYPPATVARSISRLYDQLQVITAYDGLSAFLSTANRGLFSLKVMVNKLPGNARRGPWSDG